MYAMILTRPDIAYIVSVVIRFMPNPSKEHWRVVKWILRYMKRTSSYGMLYGGKKQDENLAVGYVDSDYA